MAEYHSAHDAGGGGAGSHADPFTLQELFDNVTNTDLGLMDNTGVYAPTSTIDIDTNVGTVLLPIVVRGANTDGSDDGTIVTVTGASLSGGNGDVFDQGIVGRNIYGNLRLTAAARYNFVVDVDAWITFFNSRLDNAVSDGFRVSLTQVLAKFYDTELDNNGGNGYGTNGAAFQVGQFFRVRAHHNTGHGILEGGKTDSHLPEPIIDDCLIYRNDKDGVNHEASGAGYEAGSIKNTVMAFNGESGFAVANTKGRIQFENNITRSNGEYGIDTNTGTIAQFLTSKNNCSNGNSSGNIDINGGTLPGENNITTDPRFKSEVDGSENFRLQSIALGDAFDSPCLETGLDSGKFTEGGGTSYKDIGAIQTQAAAGGGLANPIHGGMIVR